MLEADQAFVQAFIAADFGLPVAHENEDYSPQGSAWVQLRCFPNETSVDAVDASTSLADGLWQFTLHYPLGSGAIPAKAMRQTIFDAFPLGSRLSYGGQSVTVANHDPFDAAPQGGWFQVVGRIFYQAE